ncbi:MAG: nucleotide-diphospho-sugar transferase [Cytophagia bacterium]|nr:MAG: nucleotide-diphospho-sugar transferase [Cytophagia bacterium]TAG44389.1 MAG: nucleotide-diphospho-sugar transferase [Cytophagia bacterium]
MFNTPVLFLVFNRLDTTKQVFAKIREIQPRQLFIGADGARPEKEGEKEKVEAVRKYVLDNIDWDCEVKTLFREKNLGCGVAVSEAITWFFENVEQGIILEDDTLPDLSFFTFCEELLNYYKDDERVMHIGGTSFQMGKIRGNASYYFSKYTHIWGWATWQSSWIKYDFRINNKIGNNLLSILDYYNFSNNEKTYWLNIFNQIEQIDTWDYQWFFSIWKSKSVSIVPNVNLISNLGFGDDATHTKSVNKLSYLKTIPLSYINHFSNTLDIKIHQKADDFTFSYAILPKESFIRRIKNKIKKIISL